MKRVKSKMSNEDEKKAKEIHVKVDSSQIISMAEELAEEKRKNKLLEANKDYNPSKINEQLTSEVEDLKGKLGLIAEKALSDKKKSLGLDPNNSMSPEEVMGYEKGLESGSGKAPSGSAPANDAQYGKSSSDLLTRKWSSHAEMVQFLKENSDDPEARKYYDALWKQAIQAMKTGQKIEYNPQSDLKNESSQPVELRLSGKETNDPNSELQQFLERGNRKYREQMKLASERFFAEQSKLHELSRKQKEGASK